MLHIYILFKSVFIFGWEYCLVFNNLFNKFVTSGFKSGKGTDALLVYGKYAPQIDSNDIMLVLAANELK